MSRLHSAANALHTNEQDERAGTIPGTDRDAHLAGPSGWIMSGAADARRSGGQPHESATTLAVDGQ